MNEFYVIIDQDDNAICINNETDRKDLIINVHAALNQETERALLVNIEEKTTIVATEDIARIWTATNGTWEYDADGRVLYSNIPQFVIEHVNDLDEILEEIAEDHYYEMKHQKGLTSPR